MMDFKEALNFLYSFKNWEKIPDYEIELKGFKEFLKKIGSPETKVKNPILVGGTKGKGSTVSFLTAIFNKMGKTGVYTSPHFISVLERIRIADPSASIKEEGGNRIPEKDFIKILEELKPFITEERTTFEILTTIAFIHFARQSTEFSIFEIGLGGRLDATNVVDPTVSVLVPISLDHTEVLGNTLAEIAREKCGIIKENGRVISAPQDEEVMLVIKEICRERNATLKVIGEDFFCEHPECSIDGAKFIVNDREYSIPLLGRHQIINAMTAILTAQTCGVPDEIIQEGLREATIRGRLEIMWRQPYVVFDGAHNVASAWVLRRSIIELFNFKKLILVFGLLKDKDKEAIIQTLAPITDYAIITPVKVERAANSEELLEIFKKEKIPAEIASDSQTALKLALKKAKEKDLILATGSLYLIGELLGNTKWTIIN
ncbi:MAG: bifunctional folylpolyglutamate synthase/dihydrofolate synthase [bacterium]|nr:bifunctional folylpolyglutamate synthase/dihydrofolate synthase [bacterium]